MITKNLTFSANRKLTEIEKLEHVQTLLLIENKFERNLFDMEGKTW